MRYVMHAGCALALLACAACDFQVVNPGPIQDPNVDDPGAHTAVVFGAMRATLYGLSGYAYWGGAITRDHVAGGHTGSSGVPDGIELGQLHDAQTATGGWSNSHQGRWIGEHMASRIKANMGAQADSYKPLGQFYMWAGYANRILGENACTAVFDETGPQPYANYFTRAVEHFKNAEKIAAATGDQTTRLAAIAGRASAYLHLGNWAEAAGDAGKIPANFAFQGPYNTEDEYSYIGAASTTFRSLTFWDSAFETYFPATGDPRAAWGYDIKEKPQVARATYGFVLKMYYPLKWYAPRNENDRTTFKPTRALQQVLPVDLADGREMLLIRAEVLLRQNDWQGAMALINRVRTSTCDPQLGAKKCGSYFTGKSLEPVTATSAEQAWTTLKFERLLELNMEGRRMGDRKRWAVGKAPGALNAKEYLPDNHVKKYNVSKYVALCFPMTSEEKDQNPNVADDFEDTVIRETGP